MSANHRIETLADMAKLNANVAALCRCGHIGVIDRAKLTRYFWTHQWNSRMHMVGDHLRCSVCGARPSQLKVTHQRPDGPEWGPRSEADWKRLVARLRG